MLKVSELNVAYEHLVALQDVNFYVYEKEMVALIGSNGAGKSTFLNTLSGLIPPMNGIIRFNGQNITGFPPEKICALGIIQVPEGRKLFAKMTVLENLEMGAYLKKAKHQFKHQLDYVYHIFPTLKDRQHQIAGTMSGGEQQMLAIARAMMALPNLLMLDEPSLGLSPLMAGEIYNIIRELNKKGLSIILVSQEVRTSLMMSDRAYVLENGKIIRMGEGASLLNDPSIRSAFLGI